MHNSAHTPVLLSAVLDNLHAASLVDGLFIDGTVGAGGHAAAILMAAPRARLLGFDRDPRSLEIARLTLAPFEDRVVLVHASYEEMSAVAAQYSFDPVVGILLDLGLSCI